MRPLLALLAALLALVPATLTAWDGRTPPISATPIALKAGDPGFRQIGRLRWLGGWALASRDRRFGGFSALSVAGRRITLVSDAGVALSFDFAGGRVASPAYRALGAGTAKWERDMESLAPDGAGGWLVGMEAVNAVARWSGGFERRLAQARPAAMTGWPRNGGAESLARLVDGRVIVISESEAPAEGLRAGLIFAGDPTAPSTPPPTSFRYRPPAGYDPSDATTLPDGRLLVLNRRASLMEGLGAVLTLVDPAAIRPGATVAGREIATLASPLAVDNMEGVAAVREGGRAVVWLVSDDNFLPVQRTLLMKFVLEE